MTGNTITSGAAPSPSPSPSVSGAPVQERWTPPAMADHSGKPIRAAYGADLAGYTREYDRWRYHFKRGQAVPDRASAGTPEPPAEAEEPRFALADEQGKPVRAAYGADVKAYTRDYDKWRSRTMSAEQKARKAESRKQAKAAKRKRDAEVAEAVRDPLAGRWADFVASAGRPPAQQARHHRDHGVLRQHAARGNRTARAIRKTTKRARKRTARKRRR